jgi:hypothetical protein
MPKNPTPNGTPVYARQHTREPTLPQLNAIDLLVTGKTDTEAAAVLNLHRTTVTKWRLYDPVFQAELNVRRAEVWSAGANRLQSLIPKALDVLAGELEKPESPNRLKAAIELLRLVPLSFPTAGPSDPEQIVRGIVLERRSRAPGPMDDLLENGKGLPPLARHIEETWRELDHRAREPGADAPAAVGPTE